MIDWRIVLIGIVVARTAAADDLVSKGPLAMRAPGGLVLGRDSTVVVHVRREAGLRLVSNAGTISDLSGDGDEQTATLTLPGEQSPQLAIVAAITADGSVRDWLALPLAGQARVKVDTEPLASVVVRVGSSEFGPVSADAHGVANVDIVVPPGVKQATTVATAKTGAIREKPLPLGVQPFARTLVVCAPLGDRVFVIASDAAGAPANTPPKFVASTGAFSPLTAAGAGVFISARQNPGDDTAKITVFFPQEDAVAGTCTLQVPPEPPTALRIVSERPQFLAGSGPLTVAIALDYPGARRPLEISNIALDADVGTLTAAQRTESGWTAVWTLPDAFAGRRTAHATARTTLPGGSELVGHAAIDLVAATAVRIDVAAPTRARANGLPAGTIVARVVDRFDNVLPSATLEARSRGRVGAFTARPDGGSEAPYVAPHSRDPGDDVIDLVDATSHVTGQTTVRLDALPRRFALSAQLGYLSNLGRVDAPVASLFAEARLPILDEDVIAGVAVVGYTASVAASAMDNGETVSGRISVVPALARLAYRRTLGPIDVWGGAGAGIAFASSRLSSPSAGTAHDRAVRFAATGFLGGARRVGPGWLVVEAAYIHSMMPSDALISGRLGGIVSTAGFMLELR